MIPYLGTSLTLLLAFTVLITYHYIADLRAENKRLRERVDENAALVAAYNYYSPRDVRDAAHDAASPPSPDSAPPFSFSGIGITQIRDRELRKQKEREGGTQPRFDKSTLAAPSEGEIVDAARRAANNGRG